MDGPRKIIRFLKRHIGPRTLLYDWRAIEQSLQDCYTWTPAIARRNYAEYLRIVRGSEAMYVHT